MARFRLYAFSAIRVNENYYTIAIASILSEKTLPPQPTSVLRSIVAIAVTVLLIAKQPDLGTSLLIGASGLYVLFFSGFSI
ncbi:Rod shape-determining protein RodA, partial [uncultured Gammaproteobacteria bacterium]